MTGPSSAGQGRGTPPPATAVDPRHAHQGPPPPTGWYGPPPADGSGVPPTDPFGVPPTGHYGAPPRGPSQRAPRRRRRPRWPWVALTVVAAVVVALGGWSNVFGVRERFEHLVDRVDLALHPPADRDTAPTIEVTPPPGELDDDAIAVVLPDPSDEVELLDLPDAGSPAPSADGAPGGPSSAPTTGANPTPRPTRKPVRKPVRFTLKVANPRTKFASQVDNTMCAAAGLQIVLAMHGQANTSDAFQKRLQGRLDEWESRKDAKAGGWGPAAMVEALAAYGVKGYELHAYENRNQSLRDAAAAMVRTGAPAILIAWRGAHTWVMTGFRADGDPTLFDDVRITAINVFDPWYPRVSTIWGPSDPPGTLQDLDEIRRNFLQWERPEGAYLGRDGKYLVVIPTIPLRDQRGQGSDS